MAKKKQELTVEEKLAAALVREDEWPYEVPGNWVWTRLGSVAEIVTGGTPSKKKPSFYGGDFPFIKPANLDQGRHVLFAEEYLTEEGKKVSRIIPVGSTSVCCIGSIGKCGYLDVEATTNQQINSVIPKINNLYCYYFCCTDFFVNQLIELSSATTISIVNKSKMMSTIFPLPPLAEQQRIVDRIESLFDQLDQAKALIQEALDSFVTRKAAILHQAFTGALTKKWREAHGVGLESWEEIPFGKVVNNYDSKRIPLSRTQRENMQRNYDYYGASGIIDSVDNYLFEERLLLIGEDGANLVTRNKPIAFIADGKYWVNNHAHVVDTKESMDLDFLCYFINSIDLIPYVTGSAQPKITQAKLNTIPIKCPAIKEQQEIVRILDDLFAKEQNAKDLCDLIDQIDTIKKTILGKAFRGELGTNVVGEESAVELLKEVLQGKEK